MILSFEQKQQIEHFVQCHKNITLELLRSLTVIPAPSHHEEQKAMFVKEWLHKQGGHRCLY